MEEKIESGEVGTILIKDMSRLGRDHLRVGLFLEMIREMNVSLVAVAEGIDTAKGEDELMPFRNIFAEWHARDTSKKIRTIFNARTAHGNHVTGAITYGYLHDPNDRQKWILDEEAAPIVKRMFTGIIEGKTVSDIARELTGEQILIPSAHWDKIGAGMRSYPNANPTRWPEATIHNLLKKEEYMGWTVLNKTSKETYKSKRKKNNPDNRLIFKGTHPAIVDEETWNLVQKLRGTRRKRNKCGDPPNPLTGLLYCADCGQKMFIKRGKSDSRHKPHNEYYCSSYRSYTHSCTCHYIRVSVVEELVLDAIRNIAEYVKCNEDEFIERVRNHLSIKRSL